MVIREACAPDRNTRIVAFWKSAATRPGRRRELDLNLLGLLRGREASAD